MSNFEGVRLDAAGQSFKSNSTPIVLETANSSPIYFVINSGGSPTVYTFSSTAASLPSVSSTGSITLSGVNSSLIAGLSAIPANISGVTGSAPGIFLAKNTSSNSDVIVGAAVGNNAAGATIQMFKTRASDGTASSIVSSGDTVSSWAGLAADGTAYRGCARISFVVDGTPGASDMPGRIDFATTTDGAASILTRWSINNSGQLAQDGTNGSDIVFAKTQTGVSALGKLACERTVTSGGTTGAQTINKIAGTVNFAAAASTLVVTNSLVTATSIIFCTIRTADATFTSIKSVVAGSGSFTITANAAATAETSVGFLVTN